VSVLALGLLAAGARAASAFEAFEGRFQAHGFFEVRLAAVNDDMSDDNDLVQWLNVFNLELEFDLAPNGWGPFTLLQVYSKILVQYDCVYTRACGLSPSANIVGNRANKMPGRLHEGLFIPFSMAEPYVFAPEDRPFDLATTTLNQNFPQAVPSRRVEAMYNTEPFRNLFLNSVQGFTLAGETPLQPCERVLRQDRNGDSFFVFADAASYSLQSYCGYRFAGPDFVAGSTGVLGPYLPENSVNPVAALRNRANPFNFDDTYRLFDSRTGFVEIFRGEEVALPFRPAPRLSISDAVGSGADAQGLYVPNVGLRRIVDDMRGGDLDQNFSEQELAWNRGASQQQTKELKELYVDLELFDGYLWARLGRQTIVWGKTELFRNQDRWNPQDIGGGPLAPLEEARVAQWSARAVWNFYDLGPLRDFRIETALILQDFEPFDTGQCGEGLLPRAICGLRLGYFSHGFSGLGLAGQIRPESPWDDTSGFEPGIRIEFRWRRFSFAVTNYYGYQDTPTPFKFFTYERNVDVATGRPRIAESRGPCENDFNGDGLGDDPDCLAPGNTLPDRNALEYHHANFQLFAQICANTVGTIPELIDPTRTTCAQNIFNTSVEFTGLPIATLFSNLLSGSPTSVALAEVAFAIVQGVPIVSPANPLGLPIVPLNIDPCDDKTADCMSLSPNVSTPGFASPTLNESLTDQQEALLGCGAFYGTNCEIHGVDLMNMEASAIFQSWLSFEGTLESIGGAPATQTTQSGPQPGTVGFVGGPVCTRAGGVLIVGCRPQFFADGSLNNDPTDLNAWDPLVDGCASPLGSPVCARARPLLHPYTGGQFVSEMAALSWNFQMVILVLGALASPDPRNPQADEFDAEFPFGGRTADNLECSLAKPYLCDSVRGFSRFSGNQHNSVRAGGNGRYGRRDFLWHGGTPIVLKYQKNNVLGLAMDFAEDRTATNWGVEFSWVNDRLVQDNGEFDGLSEVDEFNLTISVDRPTFITFLNGNRSFLINSQLFVGYASGHNRHFVGNGAWNAFGTLTVLTGYLQDRLNAAFTFVYDWQSSSGGMLPTVSYRFSDRFSASLGGIFLFGRYERKSMAINPTALGNEVSRGPFRAYRQTTEQFISAARDLDQFTLRIRYTF
jgi:hypothetical protein